MYDWDENESTIEVSLSVAIIENDLKTIKKLSNSLDKEILLGGMIYRPSTPIFKTLECALSSFTREKDYKEVLNYLCRIGFDVNVKTNFEQDTPLHLVCGVLEYDYIEVLVNNRADVNFANKSGKTPLHVVLTGSWDRDKEYLSNKYRSSIDDLMYRAAILLITNGANINTVDGEGTSILQTALTRSNNKKLIKYIVDNGTNFNHNDLLYAIKQHNGSNDFEIIEKLITAGVDVNLNNDTVLTTPLIEAYKESNDELVEFLIKKGANVNLPDSEGNTILHTWVYKYAMDRNRDIAIKKLILENGGDMKLQNKAGETPLHNSLIIRFLPELNLKLDVDDINVKDNLGKTPLAEAVGNMDLDTIKYLVSIGANINTRDNAGKSLFLYSFRNLDLDIMNYLLENGLDINEKDDDGQNALFRAAYWNDIERIRYLVGKGIDVYGRDKDGNSCLDILINEFNENKNELSFKECKSYEESISYIESIISKSENPIKDEPLLGKEDDKEPISEQKDMKNIKEKLFQYKELYDDGLISEEDYKAMKNKILDL